MTMHFIKYIAIAALLPAMVCAQPPIQWEYNYGGSQYESGNSIIQNAANEYIMCAVTHSNNGDVSGNHSSFSDYWLVRLDSNGILNDQKCIGGSGYDDGNFVLPVSSGGYVFLGAGGSGDGDQSSNWGNSYDYWIAKTDDAFNILWETNLGGTDFDLPFQVCETYDSGFVIVGTSRSSDGNVSNNYGNSDYWIAKVDSAGNLLWEKNYGGSDNEEARAVIELSNNFIVVAGFSGSSDGDISSPKGNQDFWVLMLNNFGNMIWEKSYGGASSDIATAMIEDINGNILVLGETASVNGDVSFNHGATDFWLIQIDLDGTLLWEKSYGGTDQEVGTSIAQTIDSGFVMAGRSKSNDGDVSSNQGGEDFWVVKIDQVGTLEWEKAMGGSLNDGAQSVIATADTGYVISGYTESSNGDISGTNNGIADCWVVKLHEQPLQIGMNDISNENPFIAYPNPAHNKLQIDPRVDRLHLFNLTGELIYTSNRLHGNVDISRLMNGAYIAEFYNKQDKLLNRMKIIKY